MYKKIIICYMALVSGFFSVCPAVHGANETTDKSVKIINLSLVPAPEPVPSLSYRLLPRYIDQQTGNAALHYYAAASLYPDGNLKDLDEKFRKWRDMPVDELNHKQIEDVLVLFSSCFHQIKLATQRNDCSWEMPIDDGYSMQLPPLNSFRNIIYALQLQTRLKIADGQIDQALELMREGLYTGRCIAKGPTIVQSLVGLSLDALMLKEVEELAQKPGSPNLYWALTSLPRPLIDMQSSIQYEREVIFLEFPQLRNIENEKLTPEQALEIITYIINKMRSLSNDEIYDKPLMEVLPAGWVMMYYLDSKKYLAEKGFSQERIESMPAVQAVLIYQKQQYMKFADNMYKWLEIPYNKSQPFIMEVEEKFSNFSNQGIKSNLFSNLLPALFRIAFLQARIERNVEMLRTIEAIRMFAANHSSQLPEKLSDISSVMIPSDPVTGKEFIYQRTDLRNARLEAPATPQEEQDRPVYILTIKQ